MSRLIGRLLLAVIFVCAGYEHLTKPAKSATFLATNYNKAYTALTNAIVKQTIHNNLPQLEPAFVKTNSIQIVQYTGYFLVIAAALMILGSRFAAFLLAGFLVAATVIFHNPFLEKDQAGYIQNTHDMLFNLALFGGCLLVLGSCKKSNKN